MPVLVTLAAALCVLESLFVTTVPPLSLAAAKSRMF